MNVDIPTALGRTWTAKELRKLPQTERDEILENAATLAEEIYRRDSELTAFEAFGEEDLYGECTAAPEGGDLDDKV